MPTDKEGPAVCIAPIRGLLHLLYTMPLHTSSAMNAVAGSCGVELGRLGPCGARFYSPGPDALLAHTKVTVKTDCAGSR